ncbi:MAG: T9SS type A sorting domain-containing protein [Bacteroidota bacterium]|nr:T9SS type A sorting domain-containing protein [Bacteroidota bacterium]
MRKLLLFALIFICISSSNAQRISAGEIFYQQIDSFKYVVTAHLYRKCETDPLNAINAFVYADNLKFNMNFKRISILNISDTCGNPCNIQNQKSNSGIEKHTYIDTIDFKEAPYNNILTQKLCTVFFGIHQDMRDTGLTTMNDDLFYLDAMINICHIGKFVKSPEFNIKPKTKTICNQPITYNPGVLNFDPNDSLGFELSPIENNKGIYTLYKGSFTLQFPLTPYCPPNPGIINCRALPNAKPPRGFYFNKEDCNIHFTPTKCNEKSVFKYRINQYRYNPQTNANELTGYVQREMVLQTFNHKDNNPPFFIGNNKHGVCEDNKICFRINSEDAPFLPNQTIADTIDMKWNYGIPDASFKILDSNARVKEGEFCYIPKYLSHRPRVEYFAVIAEDRNCHSFSSKGYMITTFPTVRSKPNYQNIKGCNMITMKNSVLGDSNFLKTSLFYSYRVRKISPQSQVVYTSTKAIDTFRYHTSGRYVIESYIRQTYNCFYTNFDTFDVEAAFPLDFNKTDTLVCIGDSILLGNKDYNQNLSKVSWEFPVGNKVIDSSNTFLFVQNGNNNIIRMRYSNTNCLAYKDVLIYSDGGFNINYQDTGICLKNIIQLKLVNVIPKPPFKTLWIVNGKDSVYKTDYGNLLINSNKSIKVQLIKNPNCFDEKTITISALSIPKFSLTDSSQCHVLNPFITIIDSISNYKNKYSWKIDNDIQLDSTKTLQLLFKKNQIIKAKITNDLGCWIEKSIQIANINRPEFEILIPQFCNNQKTKIQLNILTNSPIKSHLWYINNLNTENTGSFLDSVINDSTLIKHVMTDINGCVGFKEKLAAPNNVSFKILGASVYHFDTGIVRLTTNREFKSYLWNNQKTTRENIFPAKELGPPNKYLISIVAKDDIGCSGFATFNVFTDRLMSIVEDKIRNFQIFPNPSDGNITIKSNTKENIEIYSVNGQLMHSQWIEVGTNSLDLSHLNKGVYFVKIAHRHYKLVIG